MIDLFCIASGPSLTKEDCELVRKSGIKTVAVNNSWEMAPWCNYIYGGDRKWWSIYRGKIKSHAERWTCSSAAANEFGINFHIAGGSYNSGMRAIQFGISKGFKDIVLIGYDCSLKNGIHWHGKHGETLRNPSVGKVIKWKDQFSRVNKMASAHSVSVCNCSRYTELDCFNKKSLEDVLGINTDVN